MTFFTQLFKKTKPTLFPASEIGRYSDTYKSDDQFTLWDESVESYEKGKFLLSVSKLLQFLTVPGLDNVTFQQKKGELTFQISQGSRMIQGTADRNGIRAMAPILTFSGAALGLKRHLLELNYMLKYSRYALRDESGICLLFDAAAVECPPHKLYQALREVALEADKVDERLRRMFTGITLIEHKAILPFPAADKKKKLSYVKKWASVALHELSHGRLNIHIYPGGASFLLLDVLYRIDALIRPEGQWKELIRECHGMYFGESGKEVYEKNRLLVDFATKMAQQKEMRLTDDLYAAPLTFGYALPEGQRQFAEVYDAQMADFEWYYESHYELYALAICGYIAGYSLYQYALPEPTRDLLVLFYRLTVPGYFSDAGFEDIYNNVPEKGKKRVEEEVRRIVKGYSSDYEDLMVDISLVRYDDPALFCVTFLGMIRNIKYRQY